MCDVALSFSARTRVTNNGTDDCCSNWSCRVSITVRVVVRESTSVLLVVDEDDEDNDDNEDENSSRLMMLKSYYF